MGMLGTKHSARSVPEARGPYDSCYFYSVQGGWGHCADTMGGVGEVVPEPQEQQAESGVGSAPTPPHPTSGGGQCLCPQLMPGSWPAGQGGQNERIPLS